MSKGIKEASKVGYSIEVYDSNNSNKTEIENIVKSINNKVDGIVLSPINSSNAVFLLKLAKDANIPVVISDIGTDGGEYLSYISSNNEEGSYKLGKILTSKMKKLEIENGTVGIISIPQERANGKARTKGFLKALDEANIKSAGIEQQVNFSYKETFDFSKKLIMNNPDMKALWLQGSDKYQGALDAMAELGKSDEILLICFDSEPEFLQMIPEGKLVGAAMQQPFLMGEKAVEQFYNHFNNIKVEKNIQLEILAISKENIDTKLKIIKRNVLGIK
ncbi:MAG: substrate-binding domain-containing protein [Aliarcobacter sp.]